MRPGKGAVPKSPSKSFYHFILRFSLPFRPVIGLKFSTNPIYFSCQGINPVAACSSPKRLLTTGSGAVSRAATETAMMTSACASVMAGPSDKATDHINAVAAGDVSKAMADYSDKTVFQWVGGPLDGVYSSQESIKTVWSKFAKVMTPLTAKIEKLSESSNPKGSTVSANVIFRGKKTIKVRYILVYREGKLVNEVWQIDPKLGSSY